MLTPRNATLLAFVAWYVASRSSRSTRHGAHHDAQKLITTTSPACAARSYVPPSTRSPATTGAAPRSAAGYTVTGTTGASPVPPQAVRVMIAAVTAATRA